MSIGVYIMDGMITIGFLLAVILKAISVGSAKSVREHSI